jgi:hypothetical protein
MEDAGPAQRENRGPGDDCQKVRAEYFAYSPRRGAWRLYDRAVPLTAIGRGDALGVKGKYDHAIAAVTLHAQP